MQADWAKNKWKGYTFAISVWTLGTVIPYYCCWFAQRKAGVEWV